MVPLWPCGFTAVGTQLSPCPICFQINLHDGFDHAVLISDDIFITPSSRLPCGHHTAALAAMWWWWLLQIEVAFCHLVGEIGTLSAPSMTPSPAVANRTYIRGTFQDVCRRNQWINECLRSDFPTASFQHCWLGFCPVCWLSQERPRPRFHFQT